MIKRTAPYACLSISLTWLFLTTYVHSQEKQKQRAREGTDLIGLIAKKKKQAELARVTMNAKQVYLLLLQFDMDWGEFPCDDTARNDKSLLEYKGKHSNDYLGQLIAGGYIKNESIFFVKGGAPTDKIPDNDISTKNKTLAAGECGFSYYKGLSTSNHSGLPLLMAPMTGKGFKFDPKPYGGKAIVVHLDGAVKQYDIDINGNLVLPDGKRFFEGGKGTPWGVKGPDVKRLVFPK